MANDGLQIPIGVTERQYMRQLARIESATVRAAKKQETTFRRANQRVSQGFVRSNASANSFASGGLRNVGLQLSQVAQQAQAGGGVLRALAIQLPDLTLGFGTVGIAAGIAGGALLSFIASMTGGSEETAGLGERLTDVASKMDSLSNTVSTLVDLERQYETAIALRGSTQVEVSRKTVEALSNEITLRRSILNAERAELQVQLEQLRADVDQATRDFEARVRAQQGLTEGQGGGREISQVEQAAISRRLAEETMRRIENERMAALELAAQNAQLQLLEAQAQSLNDAIEGASDALVTGGDAAEQMVSALENAGMDGLVADAQALSENLGVSLGYALQIVALGSQARQIDPTLGGFEANDPRSAGFSDQSRDGYLTDGIPTRTVTNYRPPRTAGAGRSGGGGGGGGQSQANDIMREGIQLTERLRTEQERYNDELARVEELFAAGAISQETYDRALLDLQDRLGGLQDVSGQVGQAFDKLFRGLFDGSANAADALQALGAELARLAAYDVLRSLLPGVFGSGGIVPLPNAKGNAFSGGRVVPFARGGVVSRPTLFPMANGAGLMGEAGPEGILPLTRINGRLGVEATGVGGSGGVIVNNYGPEPATARRTRGPDGREVIEVVVGDSIRSGRQDGALSRFGARPMPRVRG
jgi:hypothetical protein